MDGVQDALHPLAPSSQPILFWIEVNVYPSSSHTLTLAQQLRVVQVVQLAV